MTFFRSLAVLISILAIATGTALAREVVISEFVAHNTTGLRDVIAEHSDWLELQNLTDRVVDLEGWALSDDPTEPFKWRFPAVSLAPYGFRIVHCSGDSRTVDPSGEIHAGFRLASDGEPLLLSRPDGSVEWQFVPFFPGQVPDVSYGYPQQFEFGDVLTGAVTGRYLVPADESLGLDWTQPDFDDSTWPEGAHGFGFDRKAVPTFSELIGTDIGDAMLTVNASVYLRYRFDVPEEVDFTSLVLQLRYEDGVVVYLNGEEVYRDNLLGVEPAWNSRAQRSRSTSLALRPAEIDMPVRTGSNVLAIHGLNNSPSGTDLLVLAEVVGLALGAPELNSPQFFDVPSPGRPNGEGFPTLTPEPELSLPGGTFTGPITVEITASVSGREIRYTTDGSIPDAESSLYEGALEIDAPTRLMAREFAEGALPGRIAEETYVIMQPELAEFDSNLPLVVVNTFGTTPNTVDWTNCHLSFYDRGIDGRSRLSDEPVFSGHGGIEIRGSSSVDRPKKSYKFEIWDEEGEDRDESLFGLPSDSDWILYGPYNFDPALIRNAFIYTLSNRIERWAARTFFVEVFLNTASREMIGPVPRGNYAGVYVLMEKIKRHPARVNIARLGPDDVSEPAVSGGYILKIDRPDPGDNGFQGGGVALRYVDPKEEVIRRSSEQTAWIRDFMNGMRSSLTSSDPDTGYPSWIDVDSWIDHHLLNVLAQNVDALRLSGYMYKNREGLLEMGPIWDFDRSMDSTDTRDNNPRTWNGTGDATRMFNYPWWSTLFADDTFDRRYQRRWRELRKGEFSTERLVGLVDSMADELREAQARNFARWGVTRRGGWEGEIEIVRNWLRDRAEWIDSQFVPQPIVDPPGGDFDAPVDVTLSYDGEAGMRLFYTLDHTDPQTSPTAIEYLGESIRIEENTLLQVRLSQDGVWSETVAEAYVFEIPTIAVTELMVDPLGGPDFEFAELHNYGDKPVLLSHSQFSRGVSVTISPDVPVFLEPGEYAVVVRDESTFRSRYPSSDIRIVGDYVGTLNNSSELVVFLGPVGEEVLRFVYRADWYPEIADGHSLVLIDPLTPAEDLGNADRWRASTFENGSPGVVDPKTVLGGQIPGDANQDGLFNLSDVIRVLLFLFQGSEYALPCGGGGSGEVSNVLLLDQNADFRLNVPDALLMLEYLFLGGPGFPMGRECVGIRNCPEFCEAPEG